MSHAQGGMFRGITWLVLVVFYLQMLNPVMLGYAPWQGPPPPHSEESARSFWQGLLDVVIRPAQAAEASPTLRSSVVFAQRDYVPAYAQPKADGDPLLASTPEFDLTDPYLVEKATELGNDPQRIFAFVRDEIGYEVYTGSLRGARGALWSGAGNALDQASLLVALLRIAGVPARYAQGSLDQTQAQVLIASMFEPAPYRVVGFVPDDAEKSDPVNDPALIAEARPHFWVEFQQGGGFVALDPSFRAAQSGQTFTAAAGSFTEVPDALRHKVTVRLKAETSGGALNAGLETQTVLDQTFTSAELVGKPLSIGHFVDTQTSGGLIGSSTTHIYSPYLLVGQNDGDISDDPLIRGKDYQEFLSSLFGALVNKALTGVFLEMEVIQPGGQTETFERALVDRVGFAARNSGTGVNNISIDFDSHEQAIIKEQDITTLTIGLDRLDQNARLLQIDEFNKTKSEFILLSEEIKSIDFNKLNDEQEIIIQNIKPILRKLSILLSRSLAFEFIATSSFTREQDQNTLLVKSYSNSQKVIMSTSNMDTNNLIGSIDLIKNYARTIALPQQNALGATFLFNMIQGFKQNIIEGFVLSSMFGQNNNSDQVSVLRIFDAAISQDIDLKLYGNHNIDELNSSDYSTEAKIRIIKKIHEGNFIILPSRNVFLAGKNTIGWFEINSAGVVVDTYENGGHFIFNYAQFINTITAEQYATGLLTGTLFGQISGLAVILTCTVSELCKEFNQYVNQTLGEHSIIAILTTVMGSNAVISLLSRGFTLWGKGFVDGLKISLSHLIPIITAVSKDPPLPNILIGLQPIEAPILGLQLLKVVPEDTFSLPQEYSYLTSLYRLHIQNTGPAAATYQVTFPNQPAGFTVKSSLPEVTIPAGETGVVGIMLIPNNGLPAPGTPAPFEVTITDTANNLTNTASATFTTPEVVGVTLAMDPTQTATTPGAPVNATLTVTATGNVAANNIPLSVDTSTGLSVSGLPATVSLGLGETKTFPLTLTPTGALGETLTATVTATFGQDLDGNPYTSTATLGVTLASATAQAAFNNAQAANAAGRPNLAATLNNLGIALNLLEQEPDNAAYRNRVLALLDSLIGQLNGPALTPFIADLTATRAAIANADPNALAGLQTQLNQLNTTLTTDENVLPFDLTLEPASALAQPGTPTRFYVELRNNGDQTNTYNLSLGTLPAGVTGQLNLTSVTLDPGAGTSVAQGIPLYATLTPSTQTIQTFEFTVAAALAGSSLSRSAQGILLARPESLRVANVKATPSFTEPGGTVQISADVISAVNQTRTLQATYTVKDANDAVVFTSTPQTVNLTVTSALTSLNLGTLTTTGYAKGQYTVDVALSETDGTPLAGVTAQGSLLVGSPLTASLSLDPQVVPPGTATTQASLSLVGQNIVQNPQMQLLSQIDTKATARSLAVQGDYAYVCGTEDVTIFDISDPRNPAIVTTLADDVINGLGISVCRIIDNHLIINAQVSSNAGNLLSLVFDLANPEVPTLVSSKFLPYRFLSRWYAQGRTVFMAFNTQYSNVFRVGDLATFDFSDFTDPSLISALYGGFSDSNFSSIDGGGSPVYDVIPASAQFAFIGTVDNNTTEITSTAGLIRTVNVQDPAQMSIVYETSVPGTKQVRGLVLAHNVLWVLGTDYPVIEFSSSFRYPDLTLSAYDASNPLDLKLLHTLPIENADLGRYGNSMVSLGNGFVAISGLRVNGQPVLTLVDVNDPLNPTISTLDVAADLGEMQRRDNILFTPSDLGLGFYDIGDVLGLSYTAQVQIPNNTGVSVVTDSFNIPPTRIDTGSDYDTLVWERALNNNRSQDILTWQMQATGLEPAEVRPVTQDTVIDFTTSTEDTGQVTLPPAELIARQILTLTPTSRTVKPGETASYTVTIENPSDQPVTYTLSVQGVPNGWAQLASSITIPAQSSQDIPLNLVTTAASDADQYGFVVTVAADTGFTANLLGTLTLQATGTGGGTPDLGPDITNPAQGVLITLTPPVATAGLGTAATFTARIINLGDDTATFNLTGAFPAGFTSAFGETSVTLLPGLSNYRDVTLTLTPPMGTTPNDYPFTVTATDSSAPSVTDQAAGTVHVVNLGVDVSLTTGATVQAITTKATDPAIFTLRVTNTGLVRETYDLTLGGPLGLYATLAQNQVTLDPGATQDILINVTAIDVALPGTLTLIGIATARSDTQVQDSDTISLDIPATQGLHVAFDPNTQTLATPGSASFLLRVQNTGNTEAAYQAIITETNGPVSAALEDLDGQPTQRIATFRLPALATGLLTLDTALQQIGTGQVTVTVNALDTPALADADTATVRAQAQQPSDPTAIPTLNEWMKGLMALLMLLALMAVIRQRRYPR